MDAQIVSLHCVLKNKLGRVLSVSFSRDVLTLDESPTSPLRGLTKGLLNIKKGEKRKIFVPADMAYGFYDLKKVITRPREDFSEELAIGKWVHLREGSTSYRVIEVGSEFVTLDANHPLAGEDLIFEVEAMEARPATSEDLEENNRISEDIQFH